MKERFKEYTLVMQLLEGGVLGGSSEGPHC